MSIWFFIFRIIHAIFRINIAKAELFASYREWKVDAPCMFMPLTPLSTSTDSSPPPDLMKSKSSTAAAAQVQDDEKIFL